MRAILCRDQGGPEVLTVGTVDTPPCGSEEVRIRVRATAVNRADLLQRRGHYPPPPGASPILGLECAGEIMAVGAQAAPWKVGDKVMALLTGGGYAEEAVAHKNAVMPMPAALSVEEAGAFPETFLTAFSNIFMLGQAQAGQRVLIHGGTSGVGTAALALCREAGVIPFVTAGTDAKCARCLDLGAQGAINYRTTPDWGARLRELTHHEGVDIILDSIGGQYLEANVRALRLEGRLVIIGLMGGRSAELPLDVLLGKRLQVLGSTLRSRSPAAKGEIVRAFLGQFGAALEAGRLRPILHRTVSLEQVAEAHACMHESTHVGKLALRGFAS